MTSGANLENMEMMHFMCQREVQLLQRNLSRYLLESARVRHFINSYSTNNNENGHMTGYALMAYDTFMSNMEMIVDMARKFNIQLQLKKLSKAVTDCEAAPPLQQRSFQEYMQWNLYREQHEKEYEQNMKAVDKAVKYERKDMKSLERNKVAPPPSSPLESLASERAETMLAIEKCDWNASSASRKVRFNEHSPRPIVGSLKLKDLSEFVKDFEFSATISYVEDYEKLVFFICQLNNTELLELSSMFHLRRLQAPPSNANEIFGLSIHSDKILRAVIHLPTPPNQVASKALLIDFGEVVSLDESCVLYDMPAKYRNIPVQAIKCVLLGVNTEQENSDRHRLARVLRQNEFKRCLFRVVRTVGRVLHVLFLLDEADAGKHDTSTGDASVTSSSNDCGNIPNPFLFSSEEEDELKHYEQELSSKDAVPLAAMPVVNSGAFEKEHKSLNNVRVKIQPVGETISSTSESLDEEIMPKTLSSLDYSEDDDSYKVITATYVADIETFYAQIENDPLDSLEPLTWTDREISEKDRFVEAAPKLQELVLAKYRKDGIWYRAVVVEVDEKNSLFKVFYVDYGNNEIVPLNCLAKCATDVAKIPHRAVLCRLADICSVVANDEIRQQQAIDIICLIILNQTFAVKVVEKREKELVVRIIDDDYAEVTKSLVRLGYAKVNESCKEIIV